MIDWFLDLAIFVIGFIVGMYLSEKLDDYPGD